MKGDDSKITQSEMVEMFGSTMPIEAVNLLWAAPDDWTVGDVRRELRRIAKTKKSEGPRLNYPEQGPCFFQPER